MTPPRVLAEPGDLMTTDIVPTTPDAATAPEWERKLASGTLGGIQKGSRVDPDAKPGPDGIPKHVGWARFKWNDREIVSRVLSCKCIDQVNGPRPGEDRA